MFVYCIAGTCPDLPPSDHKRKDEVTNAFIANKPMYNIIMEVSSEQIICLNLIVLFQLYPAFCILKGASSMHQNSAILHNIRLVHATNLGKTLLKIIEVFTALNISLNRKIISLLFVFYVKRT